MHINISGQQLDVGDSLRAHISESLDATVEKYFGEAIDGSVVLTRERFTIRADLAVHIGRGIYVRAHESADDAYAAFDVAAAHLGKRLRRHKRRLRDHHEARENAETFRAQQYVLAPYEPLGEEEADAETVSDNPVIVAENQTDIENMTVSEAVMRMDLADVPAMVFRNAGNGGLNVVYRRADGNVGWIDPGAN
ncbi:MAG: ribosome-associated translation inhibitor RaiA [Alphaproteobacteria bacterium]|nr:ribosome-associated translation inhibitor RaiA [Alphaproteobacteria bacterium]